MFEEVKEMIDSTIYSNGNGEVTAKNLNLAMHGIVDATEEGLAEVEKKIGESCSGSGALRVWVYYDDISELTSDQIAENVETYKTICKGEHSTVTLCVSGNGGGAEGFITISPTQILALRLVGEETYDVGIYYEGIDYSNGKRELVTIALNPDGSQDAYYWEEPAPASNGTLTVCFGTPNMETEQLELTAEEKANNAKIFNLVKESPVVPTIMIALLPPISDMIFGVQNVRMICPSMQSMFCPSEYAQDSFGISNDVVSVGNPSSLFSQVLIFQDGSIELL